MNEITKLQYQIIGCIAMGDYNAAAQLARNNPEHIGFLMQCCFRAGYTEAMQTIQKLAMDGLKTNEKTRLLFQ